MKKLICSIIIACLAFGQASAQTDKKDKKNRTKGQVTVADKKNKARGQVAVVDVNLSQTNGTYSFNLGETKLNNGRLKKERTTMAGTGDFVVYILSDTQVPVDTLYVENPFRNNSDGTRNLTLRFNYRPEVRHIQIYHVDPANQLLTLGSAPLYLHKPEKWQALEDED